MMKRTSTLLIIALLVGTILAACSSPQAVEPTATLVLADTPAPTLPDPTTAPLPSETAEPSPTPTASAVPGKAVSFDQLSLTIPNGLAEGASGTIVPETSADEVAPWDVAPEHLLLTLEGYTLQGKMFQAQVYVYPAEAYAQLQERGTAAQSLDQLQAALAQSAMVDLNELPNVPFFNVSAALAAQVKVIPFQNGQGVRMVTQYGMGRAIINNNELFYHFEGLTHDGQYYVIAILPLTAPGLPEDGQPDSPVPPDGVAVPDFTDMNANWMGYYGDARQMLQGLEPGAFNPTLDQLDTLIRSLSIVISN
jgi:hypothetical protein